MLRGHRLSLARELTRLSDIERKIHAQYRGDESACAKIGNVLVKVYTSADTDWGNGKQQWPKVTVNGRSVTFTLPKVIYEYKDGHVTGYAHLEQHRHDVARYAGNWFLDVLKKEYGTVRVEKRIKKVQLHECFSVTLERKIGSVEIFTRRINGKIYDYCALRGNDTYHGSSAAIAIDGLKKKLNTRTVQENETFDFAKGRSLGFCETGLTAFAADNGLDINATYTRRELRNVVVLQRKLNCEKYGADLRRIGINLNCK